MATSRYHIYGLVDPRSCELYYVGQTKRALHDRMDEHFFDSTDTLVSKKNQAIIASGQLPQIIRLDTADDETTAFHKELYYIHWFSAQGKGLKNREAQGWFFKSYEDAFGSQGHKNQTSASGKRPKARKAIPALNKETYGKVQELCSTLDANNIAELEEAWRAWLATPGKQRPKHPDNAFIAFCRQKLQS